MNIERSASMSSWPSAGPRALELAAPLTLAVVLREQPLPEPDRFGCHLDELVAADELDGRLERHRTRRRQSKRLVVGVRADVRELLLFRRVDVHVARAAVLADDHPLVDVLAGADEELGPLLQVEQPVRVRDAGPIAHQHAVGPVGDLARPRAVALADLVEE